MELWNTGWVVAAPLNDDLFLIYSFILHTYLLQWARRVRYEMFSTSQTLGSWFESHTNVGFTNFGTKIQWENAVRFMVRQNTQNEKKKIYEKRQSVNSNILCIMKRKIVHVDN
jgi:hypothetical protein